jgi:glycosyltransferase involved in cell wall biosynthesis
MVSILHVSQPVAGGVARVVLGLARAQQAAGLEVAVACPAGPLSEKLAASGLHWDPWESRRSPGAQVAVERRALNEIIDKRSPQLVHLHSSKAGLVGRLTLRGRIPTVFQPHAWSFLAVQGRTRFAAIRWERYATRWTHMTLFCSREEQMAGVAHGVAAPGRVVLNGVDLHQFRPSTPAERAHARRLLSIPEDALVGAVIARRSRQKGQDVALTAWPGVRAAAPSALLLLMGDGFDDGFDERTGVLTRAARDDVRAGFGAADVVLSPSRWEGLSLSLLEGMACGRSTIATDVPGSHQALLRGPLPAAGVVVPTEDPAALTAAVVARFRDPLVLQREGLAARRRIEADFDEHATIESVQRVYRLLLRRDPCSREL